MKLKLIIISIFLSVFSYAQDDLLDEIETETSNKKYHLPAFKAMKIGNLQSTKVAEKGDLYLYVSHRFGSLKNGLTTFFGFDDANTKIQLAYGLLKNIQISASRESLRKTYASSLKWKLKTQNDHFPVNLALYGVATINTELEKERYPFLKFNDRLSYTSQILISKRFSDDLSLEIAPSFVGQNLVLEPKQKHNQMVLGLGGRYKLSKRLSLNVDYAYNFNRMDNSIYKDPLTIGVDVETGGHVFQLLFTNAQSTNEPGFLSNAEGDWSDGDIFFGFNIVRVF